ncbi:hypothetical protein GCM10027271_31550 [Saccharopolyspora gloriosae]|uniref:CAAX prenyl protease 2/Lysostaphin resistance protein A-like domain-containing protein n=1 Tax=Saccharopolyspora gloriosae TaxID=455344 RepID=A0A840NI37_9PSEU|nr:CPBP family glutamic-type intramembrane protease [Saccharopolyspora gloriosae]MBB5069948.1 hypothetical protein [Saccharopolyspora gloriosae]
MTTERTRTPQETRSPVVFFALAAALFLPFPVLAHFVHVPGLPKNAPVTDFVAAFVPAVAALILTYRAEGAAGARALLRRVVDHRRITGKAWYLPVLLLPVVCLILTWAPTVLIGLDFQPQPELALSTALLFAAVFLAAAAGEELGWSGYALEPLRRRWGALGGGLVLGVVWWAFHIPSILQSGQGPVLFVLGFFGTVGMRVLWTWLFANNGGSVCAIIVVHAVTNMCSSYVPSIPTSANAPVVVLFAVLVVVLWGPGTLARFRFAAGERR